MTGFKGSQGVWSVNEELDVVCAGKYVALISLHDGESTRRANAKLIAAAPELLEALQSCEKILSEIPLTVDLVEDLLFARSAIAKALGQ